ncbi:hypothetical protein MD537_09245 [Flavihumibacter sediminis]|nr:hypothetical protein [Flavihumibacter sediminis]
MLTLLLILYIRRYARNQGGISFFNLVSDFIHRRGRHLILLLLLFLSFTVTMQGQRIQRTYQALHNGKEVGEMVFTQEASNNTVNYNLVSSIAATMLFRITVQSNEEASFENESLVQSSIHRKVNGQVKLNHAISRQKDGYFLQKKSSAEKLNLSEISFNILKLYAQEPFRIREVFSDTYSRMISISQVAADCYAIRLPNGTTCRYYYKDGICTRMVTEGSLYTISFNLK